MPPFGWRPGVASMIITRLLERLTVRLSAGFIRRRRRYLGIGAFAFAALFGTALYNAVTAPSPRSSVGDDYIPTVAGEPRSTAAFMRAQQTYDANLAWSSLSEEMVRQFRQRGRSVEQEQSRLDELRQAGSKIDAAYYIGGYSIPNGRSIHFYVVQRSGGRGVEYEPFVFRLDTAGKIERVQ